MALRIPWDKQETAILIDAYLRVKNKELTQQEAVKEVSALLRRRAVLSGIEKFHNENGISMQMKIVGGLVDEKPSGFHIATKMFTDMVILYKTRKTEFDEILIQAKGECVMQVSVQDKFFAWLSERVSSAQLSEFYFVCRDIETFCMNKRILVVPLFETTDFETLQHVTNTIRTNRMFRFKYIRQLGKMKKVMEYYLAFLDENPVKKTLPINAVQEETLETANITCMEGVEAVQESATDEDVAVTENTNISPEPENITTIKSIESNDECFTWNFANEKIDFEFTSPIEVSYFGERKKCQGWQEAFVHIIGFLQEDYPAILRGMVGYRFAGVGKVILSGRADFDRLGNAQKINDRLYLETDCNPNEIITVVYLLMDKCNIDYDNLEIIYRKQQTIDLLAATVDLSEVFVDKNMYENSMMSGENSEENEELSNYYIVDGVRTRKEECYVNSSSFINRHQTGELDLDKKEKRQDKLLELVEKHEVFYSDRRETDGTFVLLGGNELTNFVKLCYIRLGVSFKYNADEWMTQKEKWTEKTIEAVYGVVNKEKTVKEEFLEWMAKKNIHKSYIRRYLTGIEKLNRFINAKQISDREIFEIQDIKHLCQISSEVHSNPEYSMFNKENWSIPEQALEKLLEFYEDKKKGNWGRIELSNIRKKPENSEEGDYGEETEIHVSVEKCDISQKRISEYLGRKKVSIDSLSNEPFDRKIEEVGVTRDQISERRKNFSDWLQSGGKNKGLTSGYLANLEQCELFARRQGLKENTFFMVTDGQTLEHIVKKIFKSKEFKEFDKERYKGPSAALRKFRAFINENERSSSNSIREIEGEIVSADLYSESNHSVNDEDSIISADIIAQNATKDIIESNVLDKKSEAIITSAWEEKLKFENWLILGAGLAERSAQSYSSAINVAGQYAVRLGFSEKELYFIFDKEQVYQISTKLLSNPDFAQLNEGQHNRYRAALSKYLDYCDSLVEGNFVKEPVKVVLDKEDEVKKNGIAFIAWAQSQQMHRETILAYLSDIKKCNEFAQENNYIKEEHILLIQDADILERVFLEMQKKRRFVELNNERQKRFVSAMNKLIAFRRATTTGSEQKSAVSVPVTSIENSVWSQNASVATVSVDQQVKERYTAILAENFVDGFRPAKAIDRNRFRMYYSDMFGDELTEDDECLVRTLVKVGTLRDARIYVKDETEQKDLLEKINDTITETFKDGASCIYLDCLFARFQEQLAEMLHIYTVDSLESVLFSSGKRNYFKRYKYLFGYNKEPSPNRDVIEYMKKSHLPVTYSEIENDLWYIPLDKIKNILVTTSAIVNVASEAYLYAPNLPVSEREIQQITELISHALLQRNCISDVELMQLIEIHCPSVRMNTPDYPLWGIRNALAYLLRDKFSFRGAIISDKDEEISMAEVFSNFCQRSEHITVDELKQFASELNTVIYWDSVYSEMVRINQNEFVRRDQIHFNVEQIDSVLDKFIQSAYTPIRSINLFLHFPVIDIPWNNFVLESYVGHYSKKFRLLHASYAATDCCGAIAREDSDISDYRSLIVDVLAKNTGWKNKKDALQLLVDLGYQQRRSYSDIEKVMQEANAKLQTSKK